MKKEIRIPILGVIEESETLNGNERYFLDPCHPLYQQM